MSKKPGFTLARHQEIGLGLAVLQNSLCDLHCEISNSYPKSSRAAKRAEKLSQALNSLRCELEGLVVSENRDVVVAQNLRVYYPTQDRRATVQWLWSPRKERSCPKPKQSSK